MYIMLGGVQVALGVGVLLHIGHPYYRWSCHHVLLTCGPEGHGLEVTAGWTAQMGMLLLFSHSGCQALSVLYDHRTECPE
jgi:hypothetical protein